MLGAFANVPSAGYSHSNKKTAECTQPDKLRPIPFKFDRFLNAKISMENLSHLDIIGPESAGTLDGLFRERVRRTPDAVAYRDFDEAHSVWRDYTWAHMAQQVARWQAALQKEGLQPGDRVALMLRNCPSWVIFDQAALGLGLVVVPLYTADRPDNVAYILHDSGAKVLLFEHAEQWAQFAHVQSDLAGLIRILSLHPSPSGADDPRLMSTAEWLPDAANDLAPPSHKPHQLATIIYTSGTTGRSKGVMLSHHNILSNTYGAAKELHVWYGDTFLSFLPLSHTFERTAGYYLSMMSGATVTYARSVALLTEDLLTVRPTILVSVPRIYERVYAAIRAKLQQAPAHKRALFALTINVGNSRFEHAQGRAPWRLRHLLWPLLKSLVADKVMAQLGGRVRLGVSGGAALSPTVSKVFIGLGLPVIQGYGLTETSPVVCLNRPADNLPASVGKPVLDTQVRLGELDALWVKGPGVMLGYWNNPSATQAVMDSDGWFNTEDTARIDAEGHVFITGRLKEIIVLSNGEKVPPVDMEAAILQDPLFDQVLVLGEGRPYLSVMTVINPGQWRQLAAEHRINADTPERLRSPQVEALVLERIARQIHAFPGYAQVRRAALLTEPWSIENGLLTPTLKLRRDKVLAHYHAEVDRLYEGHS